MTSSFDCGKVRLYDTLQMAGVSLAENCALDLNGKTMTVGRAKYNGKAVSAGTYTADSGLAFLSDSGEGGELIVTGGGLVIVVR